MESGGWRRKMWHKYPMEFYLVIKKYCGKWMDKERIVLTEMTQT